MEVGAEGRQESWFCMSMTWPMFPKTRESNVVLKIGSWVREKRVVGLLTGA